MTTGEFLDRLVEETDQARYCDKISGFTGIPRSETRYEKETREKFEKKLRDWKYTTFILSLLGSVALLCIKLCCPDLLPEWLFTVLDILI